MGSTTNIAVKVALVNAEIYIYSVQNVDWQIMQQIFGHLDVHTSSSIVFDSFLTDLDSCGIEWCVAILIRANQNNMLEPWQAFGLTKFI